MTIPAQFRAFRIHHDAHGHRAGIEQLSLQQLTAGDVVIKGAYSGINYKDALAGSGEGKILRQSPLNGGIDVAGIVVQSRSKAFKEGDQVLVTGAGLGERYDGGYAEYVRVPSECVVPLPSGLSLKEAMIMGTPAFTAALTLHRMQQNHQHPQLGPIVISGASGGVGNLAIDIFSGQGYAVTAISSKPTQIDALTALGANEVLLTRDIDQTPTPLAAGIWGGAIDMIGGEMLAWMTRTVKPWGNIASVGLAASAELHTTVMPFILRGVSILGISSTNCPPPLRCEIWQRLGNELKPRHLDLIHQQTTDMNGLPKAFRDMLDQRSHGRYLVKLE